MRFALAAAAALSVAGTAAAADMLPIEASAVPSAIKDAAGRMGDSIGLTLIRCADNGDNCRYDAGIGVELFVMTNGLPKAYQIEAGWNNDRPASTSASASRYAALCRAIVAAVHADWPTQKVQAEAAKLVLIYL